MSENKRGQSPVQSEEMPVFEQYAIFQTGGKQYQAIPGKTIEIEMLEGDAGSQVEFTEVLLRKTSADNVEIGRPYVATPIKASIIKHMRGPKITVFKFKRRKKVRVKKGHRQSHSIVRIEAI